jgi:hypothetical protein
MGDLLGRCQPPGVSPAARAMVQRRNLERRMGARGAAAWLSAEQWEVRVGRKLMPHLREASTALFRQQQEGASASAPAGDDSELALRARVAAELQEGPSCANPRCGQVRGASEGSSKGRRCARCGVAVYCDARCQCQDWPCHKLVCTPRP